MGLIGGKSLSLVICLFVCCAIISFTNPTVSAEKEIPATKFGQNVGAPTMSILYCYSCGYRKAFDEYVGILTEKYPQITVTGANYDPPGLNMYLSKVIFVLKIILIIIIGSNYDIFRALGQQAPTWWVNLINNRLYLCMMIFFVGNMIEGQLVSSGAFEITLNDVPVWSKLQTGRIPAPQELFQIIDSQLHFSQVQENPIFVK